jgi:hypothetical protein
MMAIEAQRGKADTDADILTSPDSYFQRRNDRVKPQ